jgi:hypothetical protein
VPETDTDKHFDNSSNTCLRGEWKIEYTVVGELYGVRNMETRLGAVFPPG